MADVIADPETDPAATYAVDPSRVRTLTARVVASGEGGELRTPTPMTGAPLAVLPLSSARDVDGGGRRGPPRPAPWAATPVRGARRGAPCASTTSSSTGRASCSTSCLESGKARLHAYEEVGDCAIVARHYGRRGRGIPAARPSTSACCPCSPARRRYHRPLGVVGIVAVELPAEPGRHRRAPGSCSPATPSSCARPAGLLTALAAVEILVEAGAARRPRAGRARARRPHRARPSSTRPTTSASPGPRPRAAGSPRPPAGGSSASSLELGGKNTIYVAADADLRRAVPGAVRACFSGPGSSASAPSASSCTRTSTTSSCRGSSRRCGHAPCRPR